MTVYIVTVSKDCQEELRTIGKVHVMTLMDELYILNTELSKEEILKYDGVVSAEAERIGTFTLGKCNPIGAIT